MFIEGYNVSLLNLANGKAQTELVSQSTTAATYIPVTWLDNTHIYLSGDAIYILDTTKGPNQHGKDLQSDTSYHFGVSRVKLLKSFLTITLVQRFA